VEHIVATADAVGHLGNHATDLRFLVQGEYGVGDRSSHPQA
jgi:hypothetical protein